MELSELSNQETSNYLSDEDLLTYQQLPIFQKYSIDELRKILTEEFRSKLLERQPCTRSVWSSDKK